MQAQIEVYGCNVHIRGVPYQHLQVYNRVQCIVSLQSGGQIDKIWHSSMNDKLCQILYSTCTRLSADLFGGLGNIEEEDEGAY